MANPERVAKLKQGVAVWNEWSNTIRWWLTSATAR